MRTLVIVLLSTSLIFAFPLEESSESDEFTEEDGWFVPQLDGSLKWMTVEEAQIAMSQSRLSPRKKDDWKVRFYLYTNSNPEDPQELFIDDDASLSESNFNSDHQTRVIIHGWQNDYLSDVNVEIRSALLDVCDCNVISVDWSDKSMKWNYLTSRRYVPDVGVKVAELLDFLADEGGMSFEELKVIGHSLGAHAAGFAGKHVTSGTINTIIGLDPAWPLYTFKNCDERLCDSDAEYVESIHTNGGVLGFLFPIGKASFYPNGGIIQPGCGLDITGSCAHSRSYIYYAESLKENTFTSQKCSKWRQALWGSCSSDDSQFSTAKLGGLFGRKWYDGYFYTPVNSEAPFGTG